MIDYPMYVVRDHEVVQELTQPETPSEIFSNVCDEVRWLMLDWLELQEKRGVDVLHEQYLQIWNDTFTQVWAKRNAK